MGRPRKNAENSTPVQANDTGEMQQEVKPDINSPEWTKYVLSFLEDKSEIIDGKPKAAGLRRIFSIVTGFDILESMATVVEAPSLANEKRATVQFHLKYVDDKGVQRMYGDACDCYWGNTGKPFHFHPTATAATMAEGRVLRKILRLNVLAFEETLQPTQEEELINDIMHDSVIPIESGQANAIRLLSERAGVDLRKTLQYHKYKTPESPNEDQLKFLTKVDAAALLQILNKYQQGAANKGGLDAPEEIRRGNK